MRLLTTWLVVKASQRNSPGDADSAHDHIDVTPTWNNEEDALSVKNKVETGSLHAGDGRSLATTTTTSAPNDSIADSLRAQYDEFKETAVFVSEKVKRIFNINFDSDDGDVASEQPAEVTGIEPNGKTQSSLTRSLGLPLDDDLTQFIKEEARRRQTSSTPRDRLRAVFRRSPSGDYSPELEQFAEQVFIAMGTGFYIGWFRGRSLARKTFIKQNLTTKFTSPLMANRKMMDYLVLTGIRNGILFAGPVVSFFVLMQTVSMGISVIQQEEKVWHIMAGASFAGLNNQIMLGPRAMLVGGILGGVLGATIGGLYFWLRRAVNAPTLYELRYHRHVQELMEEMYENKALPAPPRQFQLYLDAPGVEH